MTATGLEVRIHEGRERAEATRVAKALNEVVWSLQEIDKVHLLRGTRATWVMANMQRREHDLILRLEPRDVPSQRDLRDMLVPAQAFVAGVEKLEQQPVVPPLFAPKTVRRVAGLATPRDGIQAVSVAMYDDGLAQQTLLSDPVRRNAATAVKDFEVTYGSVTGMLSGVRDLAKRDMVRVVIRDSIGKQAVDGFVPASMAEDLRGAWRHRVLVSGKVRRNARGQTIRIDVEHIERLPEGNAMRPSTDRLLGVGADWLDGLTVDDFLDQVRDA